MSDLVEQAPSDPSTKKKKSDLGARLLTSVIAVPLLLYAVLAAPTWVFASIVMVAVAVATWEYLNIMLHHDEVKGSEKSKGYRYYSWMKWVAALLSALLFLVLYNAPQWTLPVLSLVVVLPLGLLLFLHRHQDEVTFIFGSTIAAIIYGTIPLSCLAFFSVYTGVNGPFWILMALGVTWGSDTMAYFGGRSFGRHKLSPKVSPNKTIEGAVSGLFGSILVAFGLNALYSSVSQGAPVHTDLFGLPWMSADLGWQPLTPLQLLIIAIPANIVAQIGDLAESLLKRAHHVKDSGVIIYGHGGILDRIDGVMFATPWVFFCAISLFR